MTTQTAELVRVSKGGVAISGERLAYLNSTDPEITASIMPIPPGGKTEWMTHPVPAYVYILEGELTVEFAADASCQKFKAGEGFIQARNAWHRGRNDGPTEMRFLAVFTGAKDVPNVLHPPKGAAINNETGKR
jgi:quercetin dioxygenase-like cupin family protein